MEGKLVTMMHFSSWIAEQNQTVCAQYGLNCSPAELAQQLLGQVVLPQLVEKIHLLLCFLGNGSKVPLPIQVLAGGTVVLRNFRDSVLDTV